MNAKNVIYRGNEVDLKIGDEWFGYDLGASPLGEGAMGTVYLGQSFLTGQKVAIKRVHDKYANIPSIRKRAKLEASLEFRHPNLVEMIGYCEEQPNRGAYIYCKPFSAWGYFRTICKGQFEFLSQRNSCTENL